MLSRQIRNAEYRVEELSPGCFAVQVRWQRQTFFRRRWKWVEWRTVVQRSSQMALVEYPMAYADKERAEESMRFMQNRLASISDLRHATEKEPR